MLLWSKTLLDPFNRHRMHVDGIAGGGGAGLPHAEIERRGGRQARD
jgi:hypothetical protein